MTKSHWLLALLFAFTFNAAATVKTESEPKTAAIASAHPLATEAGFEILRQGGNAFDAAVAVSAVLGVVEPSSSGFGGGGFWLLERASDGFQIMIDGREQAPAAAHRDMYLDIQGDVVRVLSLNGPLAAGIPGMPAALDHLSKKYGKLPLSASLAPAIRIAKEGFVPDAHYRTMTRYRRDVLAQLGDGGRIFLENEQIPGADFKLVQADLARTLNQLAEHGFDGFYKGEVAQKLVTGVKQAGGIWTEQDLGNYRVVERQPIVGRYHDVEIFSAPPPSSGGVVLVEMLNILQGFDLKAMDAAPRKHVIAEAMRRAYRDRAEYLGDADFVANPIALLTNPFYADGLRAGIRTDKATPSNALPGRAKREGGEDTTHFSIIDASGNMVSATLSINTPFGSCFVPPGTGVLLNNEMDDFSAKPGEPNAYGLVGNEANAIEPGKRPLSSMTPTFMKKGNQTAVLGTPGGSRIITMVLLGGLAFADGSEQPADWVSVPRFHHQYLPDAIQFEQNSLSDSEQQALTELGHALKPMKRRYGNMQALWWNRISGEKRAASDPRRQGLAEVK